MMALREQVAQALKCGPFLAYTSTRFSGKGDNMKRIVKLAVPMFAAALIAGTMVGCGGQASSSASASASAASSSAASASASAAASSDAAEASTEEVVEQLKAAMEGAKNFQSVTVTHQSGAEFDLAKIEALVGADSESASSASASAEAASSEASEEAPSFTTETVYKFDFSGETVKSCSTTNLFDSLINAYVDGDRAVIDFDGDAYGGTIEEMGADDMTSFDGFLNTKLGDFDTIISCVDKAVVEKQGANTVYVITVDPAEYAKHDELAQSLAEAGIETELLGLCYEFDANGKLVSISRFEATTLGTDEATLTFTDYDATVVDPAPETDKTYEDMTADMTAAMEAIDAEDAGEAPAE